MSLLGNSDYVDHTLPVATDGYVLSADVSSSTGLSWVANAGGSSVLTTKGDVATFSTVDARLPVGTNGYVLSANSSETTGLEWVASGAGGDPLTTKGDLFGFDSDAQRLAVGTNGQILTAQSGEATGLLWANAVANPTTTTGDLSTFNATVQARLAVGTDGQHLVADSGEATGLKWENATVGEVATGDTTITTDATEDTIIFTTFGSERMKIKKYGKVGIGESYPDAIIHAEGKDGTGESVLKLTQLDADQAFTVYEGTEAADTTSSISTYTTPAGTTKFIKIQLDVGGGLVDYWIPCYSSITS